jgi:excisionase family DNA binding protein
MMVGIMSPTENPSPSPRFLTIEDVALELATSKSQIYALLRSGDLKGIQIGGRSQWRIERVKLEEYIQEAYRRAGDALADLPTDLTD